MELKIYNPQDNGFLTSIEWNFEELKAEITAASRNTLRLSIPMKISEVRRQTGQN